MFVCLFRFIGFTISKRIWCPKAICDSTTYERMAASHLTEKQRETCRHVGKLTTDALIHNVIFMTLLWRQPRDKWWTGRVRQKEARKKKKNTRRKHNDFYARGVGNSFILSIGCTDTHTHTQRKRNIQKVFILIGSSLFRCFPFCLFFRVFSLLLLLFFKNQLRIAKRTVCINVKRKNNFKLWRKIGRITLLHLLWVHHSLLLPSLA